MKMAQSGSTAKMSWSPSQSAARGRSVGCDDDGLEQFAQKGEEECQEERRKGYEDSQRHNGRCVLDEKLQDLTF